MENKNIIVILVAIIVVLAIVAGVMFLQSTNAKEPSKLKITSDKSQYEGDGLSIKLTDLNKTALSNEKVNVTVTDNDGKVVVNKAVKTNSKGNAKLDLDLKKGKYVVDVSYGGNDNYSSDVASQNLTVKEKPTTSTLSSTTNEYPLYNPDLGYYKRTGIGQDEMGVVELASGRYVVVAGDGYYEYGGQDSQGNIVTGSFLGHGGSRIS